MSAYESGRQLGYAAAPLVLLAMAAYAGWRMGQKRQPSKFVAWPVAVTAVLIALAMIAMLGLKMKQQAEPAPPAGETR
jgi:MFS family permease